MIRKEQIIETIRDNKEAYGRVDENGIAEDILKLLQADVSGRSEQLNIFLDFIRKEMHVEIQWNNKYMIETFNDYKKNI